MNPVEQPSGYRQARGRAEGNPSWTVTHGACEMPEPAELLFPDPSTFVMAAWLTCLPPGGHLRVLEITQVAQTMCFQLTDMPVCTGEAVVRCVIMNSCRSVHWACPLGGQEAGIAEVPISVDKVNRYEHFPDLGLPQKSAA